DPLLAWASALAGGTPAARPRSRHRVGLVEVQAADAGLVAQHPAHRRVPPVGLARRGRDLVGVEAADDAAYREPAVHVVFEDAPHDGGFWLEHLEAGRAGGVTGEAPIAVGGLPGHEFAGSRAIQGAAPVALANIRADMCGDTAVHR